ncbi:anthranilate synthase family protein [Jatrophihabitans sp.]|uniref:anthranilate synthase family protein n=1 Tax=Jatrophihabitans sp. TaxID=1932789 RepID=UPI002C0F7AD0|nr:anthranilate synthase family protein [Jatrophihabitans sp.]
MTADTVPPADLLGDILAGSVGAYALLYRPESGDPDRIDVLAGDIAHLDTLAELPLPTAAGPGHQLLTLIPFRQIAERGFSCVDDAEPLVAISVTAQDSVPAEQVISRLPDVPITLTGQHFDVGDDAYADLVRQVVDEEIGGGLGANFVLKRSFLARIADYGPAAGLSFFRRLLQREVGAYWTFLVHTGTRTFIGATPERHISVQAGKAVMNPVSGTYRYPPSGPTLTGVMQFLADRKEIDELYMVLDEELKMMARVCDHGARVTGPHLKEMARLAHTEYLIEGQSSADYRDILRETMFAPTVTGSPLESACRVIARYEPNGRGYYSGAVALVGQDELGARTLDSAILIRTADIAGDGRISIGVGATLVRHSDPGSEAGETRAKADGLLSALGANATPSLGGHPEVRAALDRRNVSISTFWLSGAVPATIQPILAGRRVLVVDAEDTFTAMLEHQLRSVGLAVTVCRYDEPYSFSGYDLVVMGPGPGDPRSSDDPKIAHLRAAIDDLIERRQPFLAVCLSHQVLSLRLGFELVARRTPAQGEQREIDLFGVRERVGFYNTFVARSPAGWVHCGPAGEVEVSRDERTGEVHALRGARFASMQFHAESVLTKDGLGIVTQRLAELLAGAEPVAAAELAAGSRG